jgi:plasmid stabilization system protein ParE
VQIRLTALAERDLQDIHEYIAHESPVAARHVVDQLRVLHTARRWPPHA